MHEWSVESFWAKVDKRENGCWLWTGSTLPQGYGQVRIDGTLRLVHRVVWWMSHGEWPDVVDHTCHNADETCSGGWDCQHRRCVNPTHLASGTQKANLAASPLTGQGKSCKRGHLWTPENTYMTPNGRRQCRTCRRARPR
jgi:hypothetical protein